MLPLQLTLEQIDEIFQSGAEYKLGQRFTQAQLMAVVAAANQEITRALDAKQPLRLRFKRTKGDNLLHNFTVRRLGPEAVAHYPEGVSADEIVLTVHSGQKNHSGDKEPCYRSMDGIDKRVSKVLELMFDGTSGQWRRYQVGVCYKSVKKADTKAFSKKMRDEEEIARRFSCYSFVSSIGTYHSRTQGDRDVVYGELGTPVLDYIKQHGSNDTAAKLPILDRLVESLTSDFHRLWQVGVHGDVKLNNFLVVHGKMKLIDFGASVFHSVKNKMLMGIPEMCSFTALVNYILLVDPKDGVMTMSNIQNAKGLAQVFEQLTIPFKEQLEKFCQYYNANLGGAEDAPDFDRQGMKAYLTSTLLSKALANLIVEYAINGLKELSAKVYFLFVSVAAIQEDTPVFAGIRNALQQRHLEDLTSANSRLSMELFTVGMLIREITLEFRFNKTDLPVCIEHSVGQKINSMLGCLTACDPKERLRLCLQTGLIASLPKQAVAPQPVVTEPAAVTEPAVVEKGDGVAEEFKHVAKKKQRLSPSQ